MHRVVAGALRHADAHPSIIIRGFAPANNLATAATELEKWGADGILSCLEDKELEMVLAALNHPIPILNHAVNKPYPGVLSLIFSVQDSIVVAVKHFQQLGLRSKAILWLDQEPGEVLYQKAVDMFMKIANPPEPLRASLICKADEEKLGNPHLPVTPVPVILSDWLHSLPKPTGILCPTYGGGAYLVRCCQALGLRVPDDIAVIGQDDIDLSLACEPTVTSIVFAHGELGFEAIHLLKDWIEGKEPPASPVHFHHMELQVRGSTGLRKPEICDIAAALKCIEENACRGITVEQLIKQTQSVSKPTFHRRFQEVVGKSPAEAIRDRKIEEVKRLLTTTELPLSMVADLSGFSTPNEMGRRFRAAAGLSPRKYRNKTKTEKDG